MSKVLLINQDSLARLLGGTLLRPKIAAVKTVKKLFLLPTMIT
jgi:hypothetical protein